MNGDIKSIVLKQAKTIVGVTSKEYVVGANCDTVTTSIDGGLVIIRTADIGVCVPVASVDQINLVFAPEKKAPAKKPAVKKTTAKGA